jgi:hypothetical protein
MESEEEEEYSSFSNQIQSNVNDIENILNLNNESKLKSISNEKWQKELNVQKMNKDKMNKIIANYLFIQGYCQPLKKFISEAKIQFDFDEKLLNQRFLIRQLITTNQIEKAIQEINSIDKNILIENKVINFVLQRQILFNYIKENKLQEALNFAKDNLLPLSEGDEFLYKELEKAMGVLAYENINDSPEKELLTDKFLEKVASKINLVVLNYLSGNKIINLNLDLLLKLTIYVQQELKKEINFPIITSLSPLSFSEVEENQKEGKEEKDINPFLSD